jgi:hypothetical protein
MTIAAAEAGASGVEATTARGASGKAFTRRDAQTRPARINPPARRSEPRTAPRGAPGPAGRQGTAGRAQPQLRRQRAASAARGASRRAQATRSSGRDNYQPIILAEFVAAIILTALTPMASKKNPDGLSPYSGRDAIQLLALTLVYLILALVSVGGRGAGRLSAWFGGLILLTVGLGEATTIAKTLDIFGGGTPPASPPAPVTGPQNVGASPTPTGA